MPPNPFLKFICLTDKIKIDKSQILEYYISVPRDGTEKDSRQEKQKSFKKI
jgi:hypothetical protein